MFSIVVIRHFPWYRSCPVHISGQQRPRLRTARAVARAIRLCRAPNSLAHCIVHGPDSDRFPKKAASLCRRGDWRHGWRHEVLTSVSSSVLPTNWSGGVFVSFTKCLVFVREKALYLYGRRFFVGACVSHKYSLWCRQTPSPRYTVIGFNRYSIVSAPGNLFLYLCPGSANFWAAVIIAQMESRILVPRSSLTG